MVIKTIGDGKYSCHIRNILTGKTTRISRAMTARRPYKKPLSVSYAVSELKKNSGTQFDPELVNVFIRLINEGKITV